MAKKSSIERNQKRERLAKKFAARRQRLKAIANDDSKPMEERFAARLKLAQLPRNASPVRVRLRCELTGRAMFSWKELSACRRKWCWRQSAP